MSDMPLEKIRSTTRHVISLLVRARYSEIESVTKGCKLKAGEISAAINKYGRALAEPPDSHFAALNIVEIMGHHPRAWSVWLDLWAKEEGRSDLGLELTLVDSPGPMLEIELDNIRVP